MASTIAAYITEPGPREAIRVGEVPLPALGSGDVLVRTEALVVDPVDSYVRQRGPLPASPCVIGRDLVGTVVERGGAAAVGFAPGDRLWCNSMGTGGRQGFFPRKVVVSADRLYHLPAGVAATDAVAVLHGGATAYLGLFGRTTLWPSATVLVGGAGGSVGSCVVELAVAAGARVIATARPDDFDWCRSVGLSAVIDYREPDLTARIREVAPDGVDLFWDSSGHHNLELATGVLARHGTIVLIANSQARPVLPVGPLYTHDAAIVGFVLGSASTSELADAAPLINRHLAAGTLRVRIGKTLPLAATAEAHTLVESRYRPGRVVLPEQSSP